MNTPSQPANRFSAFAIFLLSATPLLAQSDPPKKATPEPAPSEVVIHDLRSAYSKPTAEEVTVRFRPQPGSGITERSDSFIVRIDPGEPSAPNHPKAVLLDLGALRIHLSAGKLTAVNASVPDKVYTRAYTEPLTIARLAELLPPLPVPQLTLAADTDRLLRSPISQLTDIIWDRGIWDDLARPPIVSMKGSGSTGSIELQVGVQSRRLLKLIATVRRGTTEGTYDLTCRAIDPGDPAKWTIPIDGRQAVHALVELKPTAKPLTPVEPGQPAPNFTLSRYDLNGWQLHDAIDAAKPGSLAVILFRASADHQHTEPILRDARAGLLALRSINPSIKSAAAVALDLPDFTQDRWRELRRIWNPPSDPASTPSLSAIGADDLMWSSGAAQSLDRFSAAARAAIIVFRPNHTLGTVINLDGRADKPDEIVAEVRKALGL